MGVNIDALVCDTEQTALQVRLLFYQVADGDGDLHFSSGGICMAIPMPSRDVSFGATLPMSSQCGTAPHLTGIISWLTPPVILLAARRPSRTSKPTASRT